MKRLLGLIFLGAGAAVGGAGTVTLWNATSNGVTFALATFSDPGTVYNYGTCGDLRNPWWIVGVAPGQSVSRTSVYGAGTPAGYGYTIAYGSGYTCQYVDGNGNLVYSYGGPAPTVTNYWAHVTLVNTNPLAQTYSFYLTGTNGVAQLVATKDVGPYAPVTWDLTNATPFTFSWIAGIPGDGGTSGSVTGTPFVVTGGTGVTNALTVPVYGSVPPDLVTNLVVVPPAAGLTNNSADQNTREGFNALLVQGSAAALQEHKDLTALKASVDAAGSNVVALGGTVSTLSSNLTAGADASNLVYGVTGDAWGTNFGFGWTNTLRSWLPSVSYGQTRPVVQVPLGSLGVPGLADATLDFGAAAFASWVGPLRAFLLFLVSVSFLLAAFKIARWLAPS